MILRALKRGRGRWRDSRVHGRPVVVGREFERGLWIALRWCGYPHYSLVVEQDEAHWIFLLFAIYFYAYLCCLFFSTCAIGRSGRRLELKMDAFTYTRSRS